MNVKLLLTPLVLGSILVGCGSEQAPGYDSASKDAAEALAKNGNDMSKLTPEQKAALEKAAKSYPGGNGAISPVPGAPQTSAGTPNSTGG